MTNHDDFTGSITMHFDKGRLIRFRADSGSRTGRVPHEIISPDEKLAFLVKRAEVVIRQAAEKSYFAQRGQ